MLAPHLVKADLGHPRVVWDPLGHSSKRKTILQTHSQSFQDLIFSFFSLILRCQPIWYRTQVNRLSLVRTGLMPVCWELAVMPRICP